MTETRINTLLKKFQRTMINNIASEVPDATGLTLGDYHVERRLSIQSGEADIYLCSLAKTVRGNEGQKGDDRIRGDDGITGTGDKPAEPGFILKLYRREDAIKPEIVDKLRKVQNPCVAPVLYYGTLEKHQYVIMPRYQYPSFAEVLASGERFTAEDLRELIIPSVNEGLRAIHEAGILHKDVKPANMIPDDTGEHVVLIDFGISSEAGNATFVVTSTGMTPFYAAPEAMQGIWHRETDYYALGISVFELFTGYTPFQNETMTPEENARLASVSKIEFPKDFPEDLRKLVLGLTYKDLSHRNEPDNPNRRWGYNEVKKWLNGEDLPVPGEAPESGVFRKPYKLGETLYSAIPDLARALLRDPAAGVRELGRGRLAMYLGMTGSPLEKLCQKAEEELAKTAEPAAQFGIVARLMYRLCPEIREFYVSGQEFSGFSELGKALLKAAGAGERDFAAAFDRLYRGNALRFWAENILKSPAATAILDQADKLLRGEVVTAEQLLWILGYLFGKTRLIKINGRIYKTPQDFISEMKEREIRDFASYADSLDPCREELQFFSRWIPEEENRAELGRIFRDSERAIFGDREFQIRDAASFRGYIDSLRESGNAVRIAYLAERFDLALGDLSREIWKEGDPRDYLRKARSELVWFDDRLFVNRAALRDFLMKLPLEFKEPPDLLVRFRDRHAESLNNLAGDPEFSEAVTGIQEAVQACSNAHEVGSEAGSEAGSESPVFFDEYRFPTQKDLKIWLEKLLSDNACYPEFFRRFAAFRKSALDRLTGLRGFKSLVTRIREAGTPVIRPAAITVNGVRYPIPPFRMEGEYILFGNYWQGADQKSGKSPIEWRILDRNDREMLLISRYELDCVPFDDRYSDNNTWKGSKLRRWLNGSFMKESFTAAEQEWITLSHVENFHGGDTEDRIFILSIEEAKTYFRNGEDRKCSPTPFAKAQKPVSHLGISPWFLRSPHWYGVAIVSKGGVLHLGTNCGNPRITVRPVLRIITGT